MWAYIFRRILYNIPVYLGVILLVMAALRVNDPVNIRLSKQATAEEAQEPAPSPPPATRMSLPYRRVSP